MKLFDKSIGIDLGTANTLIWVKNKGIVLREPSVVAVDRKTGQVIAVGHSAKEMMGRTPDSIVVIKPLQDGVIADFDLTQIMLKRFIGKILSKNFFFKPSIIICVPSGATGVEKRALEEAVIQCGAGPAFMLEEPLAAGIGSGISVNEPSGNLVIDIGGGTSEIGVISMGTIVTSNSVKVAGDAFDRAIIKYIMKTHDLVIGDRTAERIKMELCSEANHTNPDLTIEIRGRTAQNVIPKSILLSADEVHSAIQKPMDDIIEAITNTLDDAPPELVADILQKGMTLTGGGSLLNLWSQKIMEATGISVQIAESPLDSVIQGIGKVLDDMNSLKRVLVPLKK